MVVLVFCLAVLQAGCSGPAPNPTAAPAAPGAPAAAQKPAGELTYVTPLYQNEQWDPSRGTRLQGGPGGGTGAAVFESLYLHRPPNGELRPWLVDTAQMAPDTMSWTFKIKDGVHFSNGDPMTADDVKFSLDRFRDPAATSSGAPIYRQVIDDIQVVDRLTVKVVLKEPLVTLPVYMGGQTGNEGIIVPKKYVEQVGWEAFARKPIGSGPYKVVEQKIGDSIIYEANENYWGPARPMFTRIHNLQVPDESTRLAMLKSGQADVALASPGAIDQIKSGGGQVVVMPSSASWRIQFYGGCCEFPDNPLKKLEVRKALTLALDKQGMLDALAKGAGTVAAYAHSDPSFSVGAPKLPPTPYDPAQAKQALAAAGYASGLSMVLWAPAIGCSPEDNRRFAEAVASAWEQIGVKTEIRPIEYAVMRPKVRGTLAPEFVGTASTFCTPGTALAQRDLANFWRSTGEWRMTDAADSEVENALNARSMDDVVKLSGAAYQKLYDAYAGIGVLHAGTVYGVRNGLQDYPTTPGMDNILEWWVTDRAY
jgi:peptide/nickel transport system substrate-binding protein